MPEEASESAARDFYFDFVTRDGGLDDWPNVVIEDPTTFYLALADAAAGTSGYEISEIVRADLSERIFASAAMLQTDREAQQQAAIAIVQLLETMKEEGGFPPENSTASLQPLGESTYFPVLARLCPLWPICN